MNSDKLNKITQDLKEVKWALKELRDKFEDVENSNNSDIIDKVISEAQERFEVLEEDLKDHLETIDNFICDIR